MKMTKKAGRIRGTLNGYARMARPAMILIIAIQDLPAPVSWLHERGKQGKDTPDKPVHTEEYDGCHQRIEGIRQEQGTYDHCKNTPQEDKPPGKGGHQVPPVEKEQFVQPSRVKTGEICIAVTMPV